MPDFHSDRTLPHIPDDVTLEQFILGYPHEARPRRPDFAPWLVSDKTGRQIRLEEVSQVDLETGDFGDWATDSETGNGFG